MPNKTISLRITQEQEKFIKNKFESISKGTAACIDIIYDCDLLGLDIENIATNIQNLSQIRRWSLREIKGLFSKNEWKYLADSLNGTLVTPDFRCIASALIANIEDSEAFDLLSKKWNIDIDILIGKIKKLSGAQIDAIYSRVEEFWKDPSQLEEWSIW